MPAYVTLFNWTEQGLQNASATAERAQAAREAWEAAGGRFIGIWWLLGEYDGVVVHEAPDDETVTRLLLQAGMQGNIRTTTMRAFGEEEIERVVGEL
ncbi:MAG: GYD domain-containing protein [Anaerolineales bacterium]|nr:GYD domain-containing protein [Anaerolineales bacterium]